MTIKDSITNLNLIHNIAWDSNSMEPQEIYEDLLGEFDTLTQTLSKEEYWSLVLDLQGEYEVTGEKLPKVSDNVFRNYVFLGDLLAVLLRE